MFKEEIATLLSKHVKIPKNQIQSLIEIPSGEFGDYSFPCFILAKTYKKAPKDIAEDLAKKIKPSKLVADVVAVNGFLNFFMHRKYMAEKVLQKIFKGKEKFGHSSVNKGKKVVIESPGPNTNKPLHLGHMRNMALALSINKLLSATGNKVIPVDIINDRGIHISKSMLAYKKYGKNKKPNKKSDHFVGDFYVLYSKKEKENPKIKEELQELLRKYEQKDKETVALLKQMNKWAIQGMQETYKRFGVKITKAYYESEHYEKGKKMVEQHLGKGLFKKDEDGSTYIDLGGDLGKKILLRSDGTSLYITQDLYLALQRYKDYKMNKMIYIVGSEQIYHFKVLFTLLEKMGYKFVKDFLHFSYGMIYLPEGKMKSREGTIVDADNLIENMANLAEKEIKTREPKIKTKELKDRAEKIALSAIKFHILKFDAQKDFTYNPEESIAFEGETGPYIQYAYARAASILRKAKSLPKFDKKHMHLNEKVEHLLIRELSQFPEIVEKAATRLKPDMIANYTYKLAQTFTSFYSSLKILTDDKEEQKERLLLTAATKQILANSLDLLDIKPLERM